MPHEFHTRIIARGYDYRKGSRFRIAHIQDGKERKSTPAVGRKPTTGVASEGSRTICWLTYTFWIRVLRFSHLDSVVTRLPQLRCYRRPLRKCCPLSGHRDRHVRSTSPYRPEADR